jgi:hypothetical protein
LIQGYERDLDKVRHGAPVVIGRNADGTDQIVTVKPLNCWSYQERLAALRRPHERRLAASPDERFERELQCRAIAEKVLMDWSGLRTADGAEMEASYANKYRELWGGEKDTPADELNLAFFGRVVAAAAEEETFRVAQQEEAAKN